MMGSCLALFDAVADCLEAAGYPALGVTYPVELAGQGITGSRAVSLEEHFGPYILCGVASDSGNDTGATAGDLLGLVVDGRDITTPSYAAAAALTESPDASGPVEVSWPAPAYAVGRIELRARAPGGTPAGDAYALVGLHTSTDGAELVRRTMGEVTMATLDLDAAGGGVARDQVDLAERIQWRCLVRTGDDSAALSDLRIRCGPHDLLSRQGDALAESGALGKVGVATAIRSTARPGDRLEAVLTPDGTTPRVLLTFLGVR